MGLAVFLFICLAIIGGWLRYQRLAGELAPAINSQSAYRPALRRVHFSMGILLVLTVLLLLAIGIVGTLGHFGSLGHSLHLPAGLTVVALTGISAWSATQINHPQTPWARSLHLIANGLLLVALALVTWSGWAVVQKYLP